MLRSRVPAFLSPPPASLPLSLSLSLFLSLSLSVVVRSLRSGDARREIRNKKGRRGAARRTLGEIYSPRCKRS